MITNNEIVIITKCAKKYKLSSVILFGSSIRKGEKNRDIDIGIKGINPKYFFKFYAELLKKIDKPIDLIDLSERTKINYLIEKTGKRIYGETS